MRIYHNVVIETGRGNRDAMEVIAEIFNWTKNNGITAYLKEVVPAVNDDPMNEFDIHLRVEDDSLQQFKHWCDTHAGNLLGFSSYKIEQ